MIYCSFLFVSLHLKQCSVLLCLSLSVYSLFRYSHSLRIMFMCFNSFFFLFFSLAMLVYFFLYVWFFFSLCFICSGLCTLSLALRTPIILARRTQVTRCLSLLLVLRPLDFVVPGSFSRNSQSRKISDYFVFLFCNTR